MDVYRKRMRWLVENKVDIPEYMQPSLLKAADAQHCVAEGFMELMAVTKTEAAMLPPPPPRRVELLKIAE